MTVAEILALAQALNTLERKQLAKLLIDSLETPGDSMIARSGADIAAILRANEPVTFVDAEIDDPVEWVKVQRGKRASQLQSYGDADE